MLHKRSAVEGTKEATAEEMERGSIAALHRLRRLASQEVPAHDSKAAVKALQEAEKQLSGTYIRVTWQQLLVFVMMIASVYSWLQLYRVDSCRRELEQERLQHFAFPGEYHKAHQNPQPSVDVPSTGSTPVTAHTRAMLAQLAPPGTQLTADVLVVYVYSPTDPEYERNLRFFLREGVHDNDGCDYVFILQAADNVPDHLLPSLPRGSKYVHHANECYDWGSVGWAIQEGHAKPENYKYLIIMNSSVRGPFLPAYWPPEVHWTRILTSRINDRVKLVGSTISCEGIDASGDRPARAGPHVQSYMLAMDQVGYNVLQRNQSVFGCYFSIGDTIFHSELGSSLALLDAGYTIDSLMLRYQGIDWTRQENWNCNDRINPYAEDHYDGVSLNPLEVLFVKVKGFMLDAKWITARLASHYDDWANVMRGHNIVSNDFNTDQREYRLRHIWATRQLDPSCFNSSYYLQRNSDLPQWPNPLDAWQHYVFNGQFEGRPFRLTCHKLLAFDPTNPKEMLLKEDQASSDESHKTDDQPQQQPNPAAEAVSKQEILPRTTEPAVQQSQETRQLQAVHGQAAEQPSDFVADDGAQVADPNEYYAILFGDDRSTSSSKFPGLNL